MHKWDLTGTTTTSQNVPGSNGNEELLHTPQISGTGASPSLGRGGVNTSLQITYLLFFCLILMISCYTYKTKGLSFCRERNQKPLSLINCIGYSTSKRRKVKMVFR